MSVLFCPETDFPDHKKLVFYGVGEYARDFVRRRCLEEQLVPLPEYFCDDSPEKKGTTLFGIPIISSAHLAELHPVENILVVVLALGYANLAIPARNAGKWGCADVRIGKCLDMRFEITAREKSGEMARIRTMLADGKSRTVFDVVTKGVAEGRIWFRNICEPNQYFGNDVVPVVEDGETYVAVGAYDGADIKRWITLNPGSPRVMAFEPDRRMYPALAKTFSEPGIEIRNQGVADVAGKALLDVGGMCGTVTGSADGLGCTEAIEVIRLDDCALHRPALISMDVEGGEAAALRGARETIRRTQPKLCISAYHRVADLFELPQLIDDICPGYRFYLRHHSLFATDTTLYALPE